MACSLRVLPLTMSTSASGERRIRIRRVPKRSRFKSARFALAAALTVAALVGAATFALLLRDAAPARKSAASSPMHDVSEAAGLELIRTSNAGRQVYRHSVIPGGVFTPEELNHALAEDAVVAAHYKRVNTRELRPAVVKSERFAYVSYRKNNQIYWTRNKVRIAAGETILTDGQNEIRGRCGNCISDAPMLPVADAEVEPDLAELDRLVDDTVTEPFLTAAIRSALDSPAGFGPGGIPGSGAAGSPAAGNGGGSMGSGSGTAGPSGFAAPRGRANGGESGPDSNSPSLTSGEPGGDNPSENHPPAGSTPPGGSNPESGNPNPPGDPNSPGGPGGPGGPDGPGGPGGTGGPSGPGGPNGPGGPGGPDGPGGPWIPPGIDLPPGYENPPSGENPPGNPPGPGGPTDNPTGKEVPAAPQSVPEPGLMILMGGGAAAALLRRRGR